MNAVAKLLLGLLCLGFSAGAASGATRYDPRLRFRTITTPRFDIHFHQGEEALALRLARIAEEAAAALDRTLGPPSGRVQVILVDQNDLPNGWATPVPYNTIEISAAAPAAESIIGNVDDWMRLVFTHEYVHIVHLGRAAGWIGGLRRVFGRLPLLYPNAYQPIWQIEGIATWQESAQTGGGRVPAGDFHLFLDHAARQNRLEPLDRASGRLVDWPSGNTPYLYGAYFHQYLADRYGAGALQRLTDETARRLPYFGSRAFRKVFGRSLGALWEEFEASVRPASAAPIAAERLTRHGFYVSGPRFAGDGRLYYSLFDPHKFPALMELDVPARMARAIATRYLGNRIGVAGGSVIFDQIELVRDVGSQSDLYAADARTGHVRRLTFGARAADPDVSPDGSTLVLTVQRTDRRELATAPFPTQRERQPAALVSQPHVDFASPRWSPDGRFIVAERRARGGPSEIVVVDAGTGDTRTLVPTGRNAGPVWSPDGSTVFFASARDDVPFQIFSIGAAGGAVRRLEGTGPSAQSPAISPDGRSLVFVGYTADGYDLFSLSLSTARWTVVPPGDMPHQAPPVEPEPTRLPSRPYSPMKTLLPRFWTPTLESDEGEFVVGAATASFDALGRHAYGAQAGVATSRLRPDWQVAYAYDRWRPTFFAIVTDDTDPWQGGIRRTTEADSGMLLRSRRVRWSQTVFAALHASTETLVCESCARPVDLRIPRRSIRTAWALDRARQFGYSISPEEGGTATVTLEWTRNSFSGDDSTPQARAATVDARHYVRAWPRHAVVAIRGAAAASWGEDEVRRLFSASGSDPQGGGFRFGSDAIGLIRGVDEGQVVGTRAAVVNLDYRLPLVRIERGVGTIPFFLRTVHAAAFVDTGHAWSGRFRSADIHYSTGAEVSIDTILGYVVPVTFSAGGAWRHGPDPHERGFAAFGRIGYAF